MDDNNKMFEDFDMVLVGIGEEFENNESSLAAYNHLAKLLESKNYFIVSQCMDDCIYDSNLKADRIVSPMGGFRKKQCPDACTDALYDVDVKYCPNCNKELVYNNYLQENYVEAGYLPMWEKHKKWITGTLNKRLFVLELGVSMRLPQVIRWPFERIAYLNEKAHFVRVNEKFPQLIPELSEKGESVRENSVKWLNLL